MKKCFLEKNDLFVEFLDKKFFPFLISVRNEYFNPRTDIDFCHEFLHNVITFVEQTGKKDDLDFYLYSVANCQPFFGFIQFIGLDVYLQQRAVSLLKIKKIKSELESKPESESESTIKLLTSFLKKK